MHINLKYYVMKTYLKITVALLIILTTFASCDLLEEEEIDCDECIAAQKHYFNALQDNRCNTTVTAGARTKVIDACPAGKAAYIVETCQLGDIPAYSCE